MKRWLMQARPIPRWAVLAVILLSASAFVLPYAQTNRLLNETRALSVELTKARNPSILCILLLDLPFWGALAHLPLVQAGLACTLLVIVAAAWGLRRARRSLDAGRESQAGSTPPGPLPPPGEMQP